VKPAKGKYKKALAAPKKRYLIGLKEILKNLQAQKVNMVILATNLEKVEGQGGLDAFIAKIVQECDAQSIPLVYAMKRNHLG